MVTEVKQLTLDLTDKPSPAAQASLDKPKLFDGARDAILIAKGSHFYCHGHLAAVSVAEQSPRDTNYCRDCLVVIEEKRDPTPRDSWIKNGAVKGYAVKRDGENVCIGPVEGLDNPAAEVPRGIPQNPQDVADNRQEKAVTQHKPMKTSDAENVTAFCAWCNAAFRPGRSDNRFCSNQCRQKAYRGRKVPA